MKYLFVVAHPDDEILGAGGMIYNLIKKGNSVYICFLCAQAEARNITSNKMSIIDQAKLSLKSLGVNQIVFGNFPNIKLNIVPHLEIVKFIEAAILKCEPDIVITHYSKDLNNDHKVVSECCDEAIRYFQRNEDVKEIKKYMYMEVLSATDWVTNDSFKPNCFFEIGEEGIKKKIETLNIYDNDLRKFPHPRSEDNIKALATLRGCQSKQNYSEAFVIAFERES